LKVRRHSVAFALVGWFLMATPLTQDWPWHPVSGAPLQHWYNKKDKPFASEQECQIDKKRVILFAKNKSSANDTRDLQLYYWIMLQCISDDDPRMKEVSQPSH
jgi:hypothetical protein